MMSKPLGLQNHGAEKDKNKSSFHADLKGKKMNPIIVDTPVEDKNLKFKVENDGEANELKIDEDELSPIEVFMEEKKSPHKLKNHNEEDS